MTPARGRLARTIAEDDSYLASVSDLMVGLLFVFIILLMAYALNYRTAEQQASDTRSALATARDSAEEEHERLEEQRDILAAEIDSLEAERRGLQAQLAATEAERDRLGALTSTIGERDIARSAMLQEVKDLLEEREVSVAIEPENGIVRLPEELLFDSAQATLRPEGERALRALAHALARALPCYARAPGDMQLDCPRGASPLLEAVLIEGHTDDRPLLGGAIADNWMLSALRGVNTFKALVAFEPSLELLRNGRGEALLGVSGYEARRPVLDQPTAEARRLNRRIDLRFIVAAPSAEEIARVRERLDSARP
jgi:flagellar motor protein MotB